MVKKKARKKNKTDISMNICPYCNSPMTTRDGKYGKFKVCTKRICGYIPTQKEINKQIEIRKKVLRIQQKKRKQGLIG